MKIHRRVATGHLANWASHLFACSPLRPAKADPSALRSINFRARLREHCCLQAQPKPTTFLRLDSLTRKPSEVGRKHRRGLPAFDSSIGKQKNALQNWLQDVCELGSVETHVSFHPRRERRMPTSDIANKPSMADEGSGIAVKFNAKLSTFS